MPAYNFKKQFAPDVENGIKRQTIRPKRKRATMPGENLYLYTCMMTKQCRKLGEYKCLAVHDIVINESQIIVDGAPLTERGKVIFAKNDGFKSLSDFIDFFETQYGLPFEGVLIEW